MSKQVMVGMLADAGVFERLDKAIDEAFTNAVAYIKTSAESFKAKEAEIKKARLAEAMRDNEKDINVILTTEHVDYDDLYRMVCRVSSRDDVTTSNYVYKDVIEGLRHAIFDCIECGCPDYEAEWVYLPNVDWLYPDTDDVYLYERLFTENAEELLDCLSCVECIIRISKTAAEFLVKYTNEAVFYNTRTSEYAWVIPFMNMPWSLVTVDVVSE